MSKAFQTTSSRAVVREGVLDAIKIGSGETYLSAFGVFLGGTAMQIGALSTLPPLLGAVAQSLGVWIIERIKSRRRILSVAMVLQGLLWVPIALVPFLFGEGPSAVSALIVIVALYQLTIGVISPIWSSLIGDVIPSETRGQFFGFRNKWIAIATFVSLGLTGAIVHQAKGFGATRYGFLAIFLLAAVARVWSSFSFRAVDDPSFHISDESKFSFWKFVSRTRQSNFAKFVLFVSSMNFAVAVAGPYYAMYMLKDLAFTYVEFTLVVATAVVAQFTVMRSWGAVSDQFGNRKIMAVCGWLVAINPFFWLVSSNLWWIIFAQLYSGFFWSGFNLAAANFVFDAVTPPKRARCIAYQSIVNGVLVFIGAFFGGFLLTYYPDWLTHRLGLWTPESTFLVLFFLSGVCRVAVVYFLLPSFKEVRPVLPIRGHELLIRVSSLRPLSGASFALISDDETGESKRVDGKKPLA